MENTDYFTQSLQYLLGILPGDITANIIAVITTVVTICTLVIRFWKEPEVTSKLYPLWKLFHVLASFKIPSVTSSSQKGEKKYDIKTNEENTKT